ncbi:MAG: ThiF family adenylyltransferase [Pseudomonadota bacterium]|nr:ThiF family adenylyltransferase [Pseudomonadota bacterium]
MKFRLKIANSVWQQLRQYHLAPGKQVEALSYLFGRAVVTSNSVTILIPHTAEPILFASDCFERQSGGNVRLLPDVLNSLLVRFAAAGEYNVILNTHDHWFDKSSPKFSAIDDHDDLEFSRYIQRFEKMLVDHPEIGSARSILHLSLVLSPGGADARLTDIRRKPVFQALDEIQIIGEHFQSIPIRHAKGSGVTEVHARQRDFIPPQVQAQLANMEIMLVGAGGIGSIQAEDFARLGVGALTLVDDDALESTNLNRWQGALPEDVGQPKVDVLARRLRSMFPHLTVRAHRRSIFDKDVESLFADADVVVGALDNDEARCFLNAAAVQYLVPYLDAGVSIQVGEETDFLNRFFAVLPGTSACVECSGFQFVNWEQVDNAYLDATTRKMKQAAGYVVDRPDISAPAVYGLNQRAASSLITEFMNYVCTWRPMATSILESWKKGQIQRADRSNFPESPARDCPTCGFRAGMGNAEHLPRPSCRENESQTLISPTLHKEICHGQA